MKSLRWVAICLGMMLLGAEASAAERAPDYHRHPVLLIHGHGLGPEDWTRLVAYLQSHGYPREYLYAPTIVPNTMGNIRAATGVIAPAAEALLARSARAAERAGLVHKPRKIDIVGYSMGAVSGRWYATKLRPERVRTFVALAGSNHGTDALCPYADPGGREMCPAFSGDREANRVQVELNGTAAEPIDETPYGVGKDRPGVRSVAPDVHRRIAYFTVRIEPDPWIKPEHSALLDGAGGVMLDLPGDLPVRETAPGNFLFLGRHSALRRVDHSSLLEHPDLHRLMTVVLVGSRTER